MKKLFTLIVLLLGMTTLTKAGTVYLAVSLKDSIGVEKVGNNVFILHKVEPKETFYSLSRRYKVAIDEIIKYNPEAESGLKIDAILKIPYKIGSHQATSKISHTVAPSQTLFSISRMYNVSIEEIKKWNNLNSNDLNVGQKLTIYTKTAAEHGEVPIAKETKSPPVGNTSESKAATGKVVHEVEHGQTLYSIAQMYDVAVDDIKQWNNLTGNVLSVGQVLTIRVESEPHPYEDAGKPMPKMEEAAQEKVVRLDHKEAEKQEVAKPAEEAEEKKAAGRKENASGFKKIVELGLAEIIENAADTKKYVALHRTAPIGTIIQVTNEMNNQNVFVRVIGKLPSTGVNDKVLIKLSKPAFERLGAVNDRFPAEISYVP